jgi:hypothetical protein
MPHAPRLDPDQRRGHKVRRERRSDQNQRAAAATQDRAAARLVGPRRRIERRTEERGEAQAKV